MTTATPVSSTLREPQLLGRTVVVIGGSAGIGLDEHARREPTSSSRAATATAYCRPRSNSTP
jgi:hypothetical protein